MSFVTALGSFAAGLLGEIVGPSRCAACDEPVTPAALFCPPCAASIERVDPGSARVTVDDGCTAAFEYGGAMATAVARLKYADRADLGPRLGRGLLKPAERLRGAVDVVVPVPLHPRRLAERGYNQAALLAAPVARSLGIALAPAALRRVRDTPRQASLDREDRLLNVRDGFVARGGASRATARGARVLLVDDVRTTGATLAACAAALNEAGAREVLALVLARRAWNEGLREM